MKNAKSTQKITVELNFSARKIEAIKTFFEKNNSNFDEEINQIAEKSLEQIYKKSVPKAVRTYIESIEEKA